ncbi:hypothetical protein OUY22_05560 [Nonomuraea sp. MCN248]|uniref:Uncharacterized protein n=1 Tax=Nonomuraea corallina TaxID=2989783 RepID=A0ABT4S6P2_9ACTN|nr:hypothetical protein [Nonomuraea corallina]MDA0632877.1 hypothetical protein [Nonomuraea corallina]
MTRCLLLASLSAAALTATAQVPVPASARAPAADRPVIREIDVRPAAPVVGAADSVRLVIDVVARGVRGRQGVAVRVEPGTPPGPVLDDERPPWPPSEDGREEAPGPDRPDDPWPDDQRPGSVRAVEAPVASRPVADGWQTWRFLPDKRLNRYFPTGTWTVAVTARGAGGAEVTEYASFELRRETRLSPVRAERDGRGVRLSGRLTRLDPRGRAGYVPFRGQRVEFLWRRDASQDWERVAVAQTTGAGAFSRTVSGRDGGEWRARFPGTAHEAADDARIRTD